MRVEKLDWFWCEETESTNLTAKKAGEQESEKNISRGMLFVADKQTAGVGRRGRSWESPGGENIYMSLLFKPEIEPTKAPMLTLVMAVAVAEGLKRVCESNLRVSDFDAGERLMQSDNTDKRQCEVPEAMSLQIKWPNDIILNKKKVCGILTEMALSGTGIKYVVIGVGINVNQKEFVPELKDKATSLSLKFSEEFDRKIIISAVLEEFYKYYDGFLRVGDLSYLQETYNQMLVNRYAQVVIHEPGNEYEARALGINEQGELVVEMTDGSQECIYAGEVSVRGVYGYL